MIARTYKNETSKKLEQSSGGFYTQTSKILILNILVLRFSDPYSLTSNGVQLFRSRKLKIVKICI